MNSRRKESIKITCYSIFAILVLSMILATVMYAIKIPKCSCFEIQAKEYDSELDDL